jgi:cell division protein FtsB
VDGLNAASILGRTDFVSEVLNKLQPVFDQLDSQFELKDGEQKFVDFRNNHFKKTGAQEFIDKIYSSNVVEEKARRFYSEIYHGEEFIILPELNSSNGTDSLIVGEQLNRLSKAPSL